MWMSSKLLFVLLSVSLHQDVVVDAQEKPNIILFFIDDLGWGDLSAYGHPTSQTPNIQKLADEGLLFTQFYTSSPVCSPSRAGVITGRYQIRSGVYPDVFAPNDIGGLPLNETTIADGLKKAGYSTGMVGKWHLGVGENGKYLPIHQGFDYYMGIPYTHDECPCHTCFYPNQTCWRGYPCNPQFVPCPVIVAQEGRFRIVEQPANLTSLSGKLATFAIDFFSKEAVAKKPFFLYYAFQHVHNPQFSSEKFRNSSIRGTFGDSLRAVDYHVGQVMEALKDVNAYNNTFIFLASDNGPNLMEEFRAGSAGLLRCGKETTWEGGMRAPGIAWWPAKIKHGRTHELAATLDLLPTFFKQAGAKIPDDRHMDGFDLAPVLFQNGTSQRTMFAYFSDVVNETLGPYAIRWKQYKAHYYTKGGLCQPDYYDVVCRNTTPLVKHSPPLLYNLDVDPGELYQLDTGMKENQEILQEIDEVRKDFLSTLEWPKSQTRAGTSNKAELCAKPGCEPFPQCCRTDDYWEVNSLSTWERMTAAYTKTKL